MEIPEPPRDSCRLGGRSRRFLGCGLLSIEGGYKLGGRHAAEIVEEQRLVAESVDLLKGIELEFVQVAPGRLGSGIGVGSTLATPAGY